MTQFNERTELSMDFCLMYYSRGWLNFSLYFFSNTTKYDFKTQALSQLEGITQKIDFFSVILFDTNPPLQDSKFYADLKNVIYF